MTQPAATHTEPARPLVPWSRIALGLLLTLGLLYPLLRTNGVEWRLAQAERYRTDPTKAITYVDAALTTDPDNIDALKMRIALLTRLGDKQGAIRTASEALMIPKLLPKERLKFLQLRAEFRQQLGQHVEAIRDANEALSIVERLAPHDEREKQAALAELRNGRAYFIARAAVAGKMNRAIVANAQRDMQQAFLGLQQNRKHAKPSDELKTLENWFTEARYLDTSAYLALAADDFSTALRDFNRVMQLLDAIELMLEREATSLPREALDQNLSGVRETRAVVLHHRGETLLAMGQKDQAAQAIALAKRLGYDPANGNW